MFLFCSGGGEFAFVVLNLADRLEVIPASLAKILIGLVVISMALTPYLSSIGDKLASLVEEVKDSSMAISSQSVGEMI
jgi:Kef-type K+ transport system membrane component KefB